MPKLPRISGKEVIRKLKKVGFEVFDQSGSHVYLHKWEQTLKIGTLKNIIKQADVEMKRFIDA